MEEELVGIFCPVCGCTNWYITPSQELDRLLKTSWGLVAKPECVKNHCFCHIAAGTEVELRMKRVPLND